MNPISRDLKEAMTPAVRVIKYADDMTPEELEEYQRQHPAKKYIRVHRVDGARRDSEPSDLRRGK